MSDKTSYNDLIEKIATATDKSPDFIRELRRNMGLELRESLEKDGSTHIGGFGTFFLKWSEAREGINPQTGEKIEIAAHSHVTFRPDASVRRRINSEFENLEAFILDDEGQKITETKQEEKECKLPLWILILLGVLLVALIASLLNPRQLPVEEEVLVCEITQQPTAPAEKVVAPVVKSAPQEQAKAPKVKTQKSQPKPIVNSGPSDEELAEQARIQKKIAEARAAAAAAARAEAGSEVAQANNRAKAAAQAKGTGVSGAYVNPNIAEVEAGMAEAQADKLVKRAEKAAVKVEKAEVKADKAKTQNQEIIANQKVKEADEKLETAEEKATKALADSVKANEIANKAKAAEQQSE